MRRHSTSPTRDLGLMLNSSRCRRCAASRASMASDLPRLRRRAASSRFGRVASATYWPLVCRNRVRLARELPVPSTAKATTVSARLRAQASSSALPAGVVGTVIEAGVPSPMVRPASSTAAATLTSAWVSTPIHTSRAEPGAVALDLSRNRPATGSVVPRGAVGSVTAAVLPSTAGRKRHRLPCPPWTALLLAMHGAWHAPIWSHGRGGSVERNSVPAATSPLPDMKPVIQRVSPQGEDSAVADNDSRSTSSGVRQGGVRRLRWVASPERGGGHRVIFWRPLTVLQEF